MNGGVLTRRELNRALLARQYLLEPAPPGTTVESVLTHLLGLQAQSPYPPYLALWSRMAQVAPLDLSVLLESRRAVRLALQRSTVHLVTAEDALALRPVLQPAVARGLTPGSPYGRALAGVDRELLARRARELVEERPLTTAELGAALVRELPGRDPTALGMAARVDLALVQVPPRGLWGRSGRSACTSAEHWLGRPMAAEPDPDGLVLRYLAAFGPATPADMQAWSGLTRLAAVFERLRPRLCTWTSEDGAELFDVPDAPRPPGDTPAPVRLLAEWDSVLLGHRDRSRIMDEDVRRQVFTENGIIRGGVLLDGFVQGAWKVRWTPSTAGAEVEPLSAWSRDDRAAVDTEVRRALGWLAPGGRHTVQWSA
ncbi:hypothetical protein GCM10011594_25090 [Nakamurella endophytica]|uniref:Winged helix DNA-binding domain-containing protein n=1 Tax=Nakamurella endophytica TaxID=1748367 RepID=A0A917SZV1_9ACTN|nr:hypothetical protein GCM10011594_25090 [Nakamurella endophytica]